MPPKKKGGKKGKKKKGDGEDGETVGRPQAGEPSEKEEFLQKELDVLTDQLTAVKKKVEDLRQENDWLQTEAQKIRVESHEYMSYMEKKTNKRQTTIVSLSDHNQKEIADIQEQKQAMLEEYESKKQALRAILMEKENMLTKTKNELHDLEEYKNLQRDQQATIKDLEREVMAMRAKHSDAIQQLKTKFLNEKREFQHDSDNKITALAKQANKEAGICLTSHTQNIKSENRRLRHELLLLIRKTRALHEHRVTLEDQRVQLRMEQQYAADLQQLRSTRQHKVLDAFGVLDEDKKETMKSAQLPLAITS